MLHTTQILVVMVAYLGLLITWGIYQGRKVKTNTDYAIAGRQLPGWVAALSERATGESSWALLGLPGAAYATGLLELWTAIGCVAGIVCAWGLLAWRLRAEAETYQAKTFTDYLAKKHHHWERSIRALASMTIVFFFFIYVGSQFLGGGKILKTLFNLDPRWGMLITAGIIVPYTIYGGFRSVVYTDVIQALVMIVALVLGPIAGLIYLSQSGDPELFAHSIREALHKAGPSHRLSGGLTGFQAGVVIMGGLSWFFGYLGGLPQLSVRFMAIRDTRQAKLARNIGIAWTIVAYTGALTLGWIGLAIFGPTGLEDREFVMPAVLLRIFPPALAALLITGAVAAMISTADSLLILSATELAENIIKPLLRSRGKLRGSDLTLSRWVTAALAAIALVVAYVSPQTLIHTLVGYVWAGVGGAFSVVILLSLFWRAYRGLPVLITIATGLSFTITWIGMGWDAHISARVMTFVVTGLVALLSTWIIPSRQEKLE